MPRSVTKHDFKRRGVKGCMCIIYVDSFAILILELVNILSVNIIKGWHLYNYTVDCEVLKWKPFGKCNGICGTTRGVKCREPRDIKPARYGGKDCPREDCQTCQLETCESKKPYYLGR